MEKETPMMQQYERAKKNYPDALLFFRLGDFYEMFKNDALEVSRLLGLTLTQRQGVPMCGVPSHASKNYIRKLIELGKTVALCDQVSPKGKGLVERRVTEVISPATVLDDAYRSGNESRYIASIGKHETGYALSWLELSLGELTISLIDENEIGFEFKRMLESIDPRELLVQKSLLDKHLEIGRILSSRSANSFKTYPDWHYDQKKSFEKLRQILGVSSLQAFGIDKDDPALYSCTPLLEYAEYMLCHELKLEKGIVRIRTNDFVIIDETCIRNLELVKNMRDGGVHHTLFQTLDETKTPMGGRLLREWIIRPARSRGEIEKRLLSVTHYYKNQDKLAMLRKDLSKVHDIERLLGRLVLDRASPKDIASLGLSLKMMTDIRENIFDLSLFLDPEELSKLDFLKEYIDKQIVENPPYDLEDGGVIQSGAHPELDALRNLAQDSEAVLQAYLSEEKIKTGLNNLKLSHNRIIGHYFELSRRDTESVPPYFIRKHSTVNTERFSTQRLADLERAIDKASIDIISLEAELFAKVLGEVKLFREQVTKYAQCLAYNDVLASFAYTATAFGYTKPIFTEADDFYILNGRHPVVEKATGIGNFVPNNSILGTFDYGPRIVLLTGPNMAGKSTYLRQNALIALMAHMGSFVPAEEARFSLIDKIFCRVGASDNLSGGESTFLVEMNETALILRHATKDSLIIMDEVGRGTSTEDGLAIAQAVLEFLAEKLGSKTFFATHFHELTSLSHYRITNKSLSVVEENGEIIFLKKLYDGAIDHSYGIHVASLAGIPGAIIKRAQEILDNPNAKTQTRQIIPQKTIEQDLFSPLEELQSMILSFKVDEKTPLDALNIIAKWQKYLKNSSN